MDDLVQAHLDALEYLASAAGSIVLNCGYGRGYSVREVIETVRHVSGADFPVEEAPRRPGEPVVLVASHRKIREMLGWQPRHDDLEFIVRTAWDWERWLQMGGRLDAFGAACRATPIPELGAH